MGGDGWRKGGRGGSDGQGDVIRNGEDLAALEWPHGHDGGDGHGGGVGHGEGLGALEGPNGHVGGDGRPQSEGGD